MTTMGSLSCIDPNAAPSASLHVLKTNFIPLKTESVDSCLAISASPSRPSKYVLPPKNFGLLGHADMTTYLPSTSSVRKISWVSPWQTCTVSRLVPVKASKPFAMVSLSWYQSPTSQPNSSPASDRLPWSRFGARFYPSSSSTGSSPFSPSAFPLPKAVFGLAAVREIVFGCIDLPLRLHGIVEKRNGREFCLHNTGIDSSKAFDMINRAKLIALLKASPCTTDQARLITNLLQDTTLSIKYQNHIG